MLIHSNTDFSDMNYIILYLGDICRSGHYCEEGSWSGEPCPSGYYLPSSGARNITYCLQCTAGQYCNQSGLISPQGPCQSGLSLLQSYYRLKRDFL